MASHDFLGPTEARARRRLPLWHDLRTGALRGACNARVPRLRFLGLGVGASSSHAAQPGRGYIMTRKSFGCRLQDLLAQDYRFRWEFGVPLKLCG